MTSRDRRGDVVVVGAGPVGLATTLLLARWQVPTVLLEAKPAPDPVGSKAICTQRDVLDIFDRIGCAEQMVAEGVTWWCGRTFYRDRELFQITFPDPGRSAFPPFINLGQASTERYLWQRVDAEPLVDVRLGHRVRDLEQGDDGLSMTADTGDGVTTLAARYVVACDGARSAVRRLLGLPFDGHSFSDQFLIADIRADLPFDNERRFYFDPEWNPGRQVLVHPQPDSVWRIDWQVPADFDLEAERASGELDGRIRRIVGDRDYELVWVTAYRFHQRVVPTFRQGRVLLAGDAAHLMSPFGARGLNSGVQDAENAAWKLAFVLHGWSEPSLLDSYDAERRPAALENLRVTGDTMRFLVPQDDREWAWRRDTLRRAVDDPRARASVDSGKLAEPFCYLDSPLTTATPGTSRLAREHGVAPPPVPGVLCPDGPCTAARPGVSRLRQLFGDGFVVLVGGSQLTPRLRDACRRDAGVPTDVYCLDDIDASGVLGAALQARAGRAHVVRPDGHLAAVLDAAEPATVVAAVRRAAGRRP